MLRCVPLLLLGLLSAGEACSCVMDYIPEDETFTSPATHLLQAPFVFVGKVLSVTPADQLPEGQAAYCASAPKAQADDPWGDPCDEGPNFKGYFSRWSECGRGQIAEIQVTQGLKGIETGETFRYNCTLASCGDCSPPCPQVGDEILDGTDAAGARSVCSSRRCSLAGSDQCQQLLKELRSPRTAQGRLFQIPVPVAFSTLKANSYFRSELLQALITDILEALNFRATMEERTRFDVKSANLVQDPQRTVRVVPAAILPSSLFEITFHYVQPGHLDSTERRLQDIVLRTQFTWTAATRTVENFCRREPCPLCETTCVDPAETALVYPGPEGVFA